MAALSITAASVVQGTGAAVATGNVAGETVTAGQVVYKKSSDNKWWLSQADGTAAEAAVSGVALHAALANQPLAVQTAGQITIGATIAAGVFYYVHTTAGSIGPVGDLGSTNYPSVVGYGVSTTVMQINPIVPGVALA